MNWRVLRALNTLYNEGQVKKSRTLVDDGQIRFLLNSTREIVEGRKFLTKGDGFDKLYETEFKEKYRKYEEFLLSENLLKPQTRFEEEDIQSLIEIRKLMESSELEYLRNQIIDAKEDVRGVSLIFLTVSRNLCK